jgi:anti-anti-sigma factor
VTTGPAIHDPGDTPFEVLLLRPSPSRVDVVVRGEVDAVTGQALAEALSSMWAERPAHLVLDLGAVTFLSASSLGVLLDARERACVEDTTFEVVAGPGVRRLMSYLRRTA